MHGIELGQGLLVGQAVAAGEGLGRWSPAIAQVMLGVELGDQSRHLLAASSR